jgi:hypothetical protein
MQHHHELNLRMGFILHPLLQTLIFEAGYFNSNLILHTSSLPSHHYIQLQPDRTATQHPIQAVSQPCAKKKGHHLKWITVT